MRHLPARFALAALIAAGSAAALAEPVAPGKVAGLYIQTARHLLVEISLARRSAAHRTAPGTVVAEIHFAQALADGRTSTFATINEAETPRIEPGDVVTVALTESKGGKVAAAPMRRSDQVRAIEAKFHTDVARAFGRTAPVRHETVKPRGPWIVASLVNHE